MDLDGLVKLDHVMDTLSVHMNDYSDAEYDRYFNIMVQGITDINLYHDTTVKTVNKTMSLTNTIDMPSDYIALVFVAMPIRGEYWHFTNKDVIVSRSMLEGAPALDSDRGEDHDIGDSISYRISEKGGKNQYYVTVDKERRQIVINGAPRREVVLRYVGTGVSLDSETYIPRQHVMALVYHIIHAVAAVDPNMNDYYVQRIARLKQEEENKIEALQIPDMQEMIDAYYSGMSGSVRR